MKVFPGLFAFSLFWTAMTEKRDAELNMMLSKKLRSYEGNPALF